MACWFFVRVSVFVFKFLFLNFIFFVFGICADGRLCDAATEFASCKCRFFDGLGKHWENEEGHQVNEVLHRRFLRQGEPMRICCLHFLFPFVLCVCCLEFEFVLDNC